MKIVHIPMATASYVQLKQYAELELGLEVKHGTSADAIRKMIDDVEPGLTQIKVLGNGAGAAPDDIAAPAPGPVPEEIDTSGDPNPAPPSKAEREDPNEMEWCTIVIHEQERPGGKDAVFIQVNGRAIWVERGKEQTIKRKYVNVLDDAKERIGEQQNEREIVWRTVPSHPYQMIRTEKRAA